MDIPGHEKIVRGYLLIRKDEGIMTYICHRSYSGLAETGKTVHIKRGKEYPLLGTRIARNNASICAVSSSVGRLHFARNDDGQGLKRGALTYAIAYRRREREHSDGRVFRFSEAEIDMLRREWNHFLAPDKGVIRFCQSFFDADVAELEKLATVLHIEVKEETK